jgi:hypothetical protein
MQAEPTKEVKARQAMTVAQERSSALILANELRIQAHEVLIRSKKLRNESKFALVIPIFIEMAVSYDLSAQFNDPRSKRWELAADTIYWISILVALNILVFVASRHWRRKKRAKARASFLFAISDHIINAKGDVTSPSIRDLIDYAVQHGKDEDADVKTISGRLEALRALEAAMPSAETLPTAHAPS